MSPTYEYECKGCNHIFRAIRQIKDRKKTAACPCCGLKAKRILVNPIEFILKGKGWPGKEIKNGNNKSKTT